ncbi:MAG: hypothetical protein EA365_04240 [Gloeocapsa sp. DLM2.Bin57]|nr:MAG: hypothetical protein EA365_04240 [Gloeocapsa sp. DLM2.Bin57]
MSKQWSEVSTHPPFLLLQVATSVEVTQFNLLLPCFNLDNYSPQFWLECPNISTNTSKILPTTIRLLLESEDQQWRLVRLIFSGLLPDTEYCLKIAHNLDLDSRWFKTLPRERLEKLATYGLVAFRYNFGVFTTKFVDNRYLDLRVKVVADNRNILFNFATELD